MAGTSFTFTLVAKVDPHISDNNGTGTTLDTKVEASAFTQGPSSPPAASDTYDLDPSNNVAHLVTTATNRANVSVTKSVAPTGTRLTGNTVIYTITVKNTGPNPFVNPTLSDAIDTTDLNVTAVGGTHPGWTCNAPGGGTA